MKKSLKRIAAISIISIFAEIAQINAQTIESFREITNIEPSAEAWKITRQEGLTPSLYSGALQWCLPLYTYKDPDFELPISLLYHFDGFKPRESTGTIGLDWALDAGGVITREVRGLRDEHLESLPDGNNVLGYYHAWKDSLNMSSPQGCRLLRGDVVYSSITDYGDTTLLDLVQCNMANDVIVCRPTMYNELYDMEPDIFRFNFCGHSGEFHFTSNGEIDLFCQNESSSDFRVEVGNMQGPDCASFNFKIITADGYIYSFGTALNSWEYCTNTCYYTDNPKGLQDTFDIGAQTITAWKLSSIKTPGGRELIFDYESLPNIEITTHDYYSPSIEQLDIIDVNNTSTPSYKEKRINMTRTRLLKQIRLKSSGIDKSIVQFSWSERTPAQNEQLLNNYQRGSAILSELNLIPNRSNKILSEITIKNVNGLLVEQITLNHSVLGTSNGPRRLLLDSVITKSSGKWTFCYNPIPDGDTLPVANTESNIDIFGYWGGSSLADLRGLTEYGDGGLSLQSGYSNTSLPRQMTGGLTRITYPTGGYTSIEYEKNKVKWLLDRSRSSLPYMKRFDNEVGGVRVRKITDYSDAKPAYSKEYSYSDGVLWDFPRLMVQCDYNKTIILSYEQTSTTLRLRSKYFSSNGYCLSKNHHHIGYETVIELHPNGSRTAYNYYGWNQYPDSYPETVIGLNTDVNPITETESLKLKNMLIPASEDWSLFRGLLKSVVQYDTTGELMYSQELSYTTSIPSISYNAVNMFSINAVQPTYRFKPLLSSMTEISNGLSIKTDWTRNSFDRVVRKTVTDLQTNESKHISFSYCDGLTSSEDSIHPGAIKDILVSFQSDAASQRYVTNYTEYKYHRSDQSAKPSSIIEYKIDTPIQITAWNNTVKATLP